MIRYSTPHVISAATRLLANQYSILAALNRHYEPTQTTPALPPDVVQRNLAYNKRLDLMFRERGIPMARFRTAPTNDIVVGEFGDYNLEALMRVFQNSRNILRAINCPLHRLSGFSELVN